MIHNFYPFDPFTFQTAEKFQGQIVLVICRDGGMTGSYVGELQPVSNGRTKVGDDEIFNECITLLNTEVNMSVKG